MFKMLNQSEGPRKGCCVTACTDFVELVDGRRVSGIPPPSHGVEKPIVFHSFPGDAELNQPVESLKYN
jgi:Tat protein secretion system quality control protein TatD with DNase activity